MSACSLQAVSHSGWRLMVASSAKISRPRCIAPEAGARPFTFERNASTSLRDDAVAGSPPRRAGVTSRGLSAIVTSALGRHLRPAPKVGISAAARNAAIAEAHKRAKMPPRQQSYRRELLQDRKNRRFPPYYQCVISNISLLRVLHRIDGFTALHDDALGAAAEIDGGTSVQSCSRPWTGVESVARLRPRTLKNRRYRTRRNRRSCR